MQTTQSTYDVRRTPPIVAIVGSAGCRQSLEMLFRNLPNDSGMAFVISTRLGSRQLNALPQIVQKRTAMSVVVAADGVPLQADRVYVAPAAVQLSIEKGVLQLQSLDQVAANETSHGPLDRFLASLIETDHQERAAILLSGTGSDGIAGLAAVEAAGGLILIQDPEEAAHGALPRRAVAACPNATVATAGELARCLIQQQGDLVDGPAIVRAEVAESFDDLYTAILDQVNLHTGHDLRHYKVSTMRRRIARRLSITGVASLAQYIALLRRNSDEAYALFQDSLVSVTSFFRDPDAYTMLEQDCIPQLFAEKGGADNVRVWVVGCATGQEAYSITIQLVEYAAQVHEPPRLQVFATDLDEAAIAFARRGIYPKAVAEQMTSARLERYFSVEENGYRIKPEIREHVLFAVHDLLKDPPFSNLDLISCRNVLIYFNREAQSKAFAIFHYALNRERVGREYLFLGTSESVDAAPELFAVIDKYCHLFQRRDVISLPRQRQLPSPTLSGERQQDRGRGNSGKPTRTLEELYTAWSLRVHTPPRLLVNNEYEITHLFGDVRRYLQEPEGAVTQSVLLRILPALRLDLRTALYQAFQKQERSISRALSVELDDTVHLIHLHVGPITEPGFPEGYAEVVFVADEGTAMLGVTDQESVDRQVVATDLALVARMEEELVRTRERLQTIIEEYENSSQELKTSNEELQSINEELKSTSEELETSKEELQSMNEELVTVNGELTDKVEELNQANSDLLNLIASTDVGTIFLSNDLRINRFT
ncbi:MAG TPA: CheR family methyltransferase, partial [Caldilineaceae bacterium]|nr:CheR family methyltransferase [Caldilineaceae bacterium]